MLRWVLSSASWIFPIVLLSVSVPMVVMPEGAIAQTPPTAPEAQTSLQSLLEAGKQAYRRAEFKRAIAIYQQVLAIATPAKAYRAQLEALDYLADIDLGVQRLAAGEAKAQQGLQLAKQVGDRAYEAKLLATVSAAYRLQGNYSAALETAQQAVELARQAKDVQIETRSHFMLGIALYHQEKYDQALATLQQALQQAQATPDQDEVAFILNWVALTQVKLKNPIVAKTTMQQQQLSRTIGLKLAEYYGLWVVVMGQAQAQSNPQAELAIYYQALALAQAADNPWFQIVIAKEIGWIYVTQKQLPKALEVYESALKIAQTVDDEAVADLRNQIGVAYYRFADYPQAIEQFERSRDLYQQVKNQSMIAKVWSNLGDVARQLKQYSQAQDHYQKALVIYQQLKDNEGMGNIRNRIGNIYFDLKQSSQALELYQQAIASYQQTTNQEMIAQIWININSLYWQDKQYEKCLEALQQGLAIYRSLGDKNGIGNIENRLGVTYGRLQQFPQEVESYQRSISAYQKTQNYKELTLVFGNMAIAYTKQKDFQKSLMYYQEQLKFYRSGKVDDKLGEAYSLRGIARTYHQLKDPKSAINFYLQALELFKAQKPQLQKPSHQYADALTLWELGNRYFDEKQYQQALQVYQDSLAAYRGSAKDEADVLRAISNTYSQLDQPEKASQIYQQSLEKAQQDAGTQLNQLDAQDQQTSTRTESPTTIAESNIPIEGTWNIAQGTEFDGKPYSGKLTIAKLKNAYTLFWKLSGGDRTGIALLENGKLFVGWGEGESSDYGVVAYKIGKDGSLSGKWANSGGYIGTERLEKNQKGQISGNYQLNGRNFNGATYQGSVEIRQVGEIYQIFWEMGAIYRGVGFRIGDYLVVGWGTSGNPGAAIYDLQSLPVNGQLALFQQGTLISETMIDPQLDPSKNPLAAVIRLEREANNLYSAGQSEAAIQTFQKAVEMARKIPDRQREAKLLQGIGGAYTGKEQYRKALEYYEQALVIYRELKHPIAESSTSNAMGIAYSRQGQYTKSLEAYQQALTIRQTLNRSDNIAHTLTNIGITYTKLGRYPQALTIHQQALDLFQKLENYFGQGSVLNYIGLTYAEQGNYEEAIKNYEMALERLKKGASNVSLRGVILKNIGLIYASKGDYPKALLSYQDSLEAHRSALNRNRSDEAATLTSQGQVARDLGQSAKALEIYQNALAIYREFGYRAAEGEILSIIGEVYAAQKELTKAIDLYQQALRIHDEVGNLPGKITTLSNLGSVYSAMGNPKALEIHQQALEIAQQVNSLPRTSQVLNNLAQTQKQLGQHTAAQNNLQQAIAIAQTIGNSPIAAQATANLANLSATDQPELAIALYKQSVATYEEIRKGLAPLPKEQQQAYTDTVATTYRELADLLLKRDRILEARQVIELLKLQELDDYNKNTRGQKSPLTFLKAETELLEAFNQKVTAKQSSIIQATEELAKLRSQSTKTEADNQRIRELEKLTIAVENNLIAFINEKTIQALIQQLKTEDKVPQLEGDNIKTLQGNLKDLEQSQQKAAIVYPLVLDDRLEIIVITADNLLRRTVKPFDRVEFNRLIGEMSQTLASPTTEPKPIAQKLYQILMAPIAQDLQQAQVNTIIYSPDRRLRTIPLGTLHDGTQWLAERFQISYITASSATNLIATRKGQPKVLAGTISDQPATMYTVALPNSNESHRFQGLPAGKPEVTAIKNILTGSQTLEGATFTSDQVRDSAGNFNILHFATHGLFQLGQPDQSFILFGGKDSAGKNYATIQDIRNWNLRSIDLVTLSACQTATVTEKLDSKLGIMGLGYQVQSAGAKAALAALWEVNDNSTALLMKSFYRHLGEGKTKAEALRLAQLEIMNLKNNDTVDQAYRDLTRFTNIKIIQSESTIPPRSTPMPGYTHPYYWAPFILIGNSL